MKIKKLRIDNWGEFARKGSAPLSGELFQMSGYANQPSLRVLVDEVPKGDLTFEGKKVNSHTLYFAEHDGYVEFYAHDPRDESGYGGRGFKLKVKDNGDEREVQLKGPWSSRAGVMNSHGFTPCLDVAITDDEGVWARGWTFIAGAITLESVLDFLKQNDPEGLPANFNLHFVTDDEGAYVPVPMKLGVMDDTHGLIFPLPQGGNDGEGEETPD